MFSKLSHPVRAIREPFGTAGLIVAAIALIAALGGVAFAAAKITSAEKKEIKKFAKLYSQKFAKPGPQGPKGDPGAKGDQGAPGANGKSVAVTAISCGGLGGAEVKQEGAATGVSVCNGEPGETGFTETLPAGKTETGSWSTATSVSHLGYASLPFNIPLAQPLDSAHVIRVKEGEEGELGKCSDAAGTTKGTDAHPLAAPGYLCVYVSFAQPGEGPLFLIRKAGEGGGLGASTAGAAVLVSGPENETTHELEDGFFFGTYAVTAPTP